MRLMAARRILQLGDPVLREKSQPVGWPADAAPVLVDLRDTLHEFRSAHGFGRGISAIQIGQPWRIVYLEFEGRSYSLLNPVCERLSEERMRLWDDCFSFPGLLVQVERARETFIRYLDGNGEARTLPASGALSELLQHEMDHLDGVLAIDRAIDRNSFRTREEHERQIKLPRSVLPWPAAAPSR
ncbi:MAG: peptide deformylase [Bryobacterales bacterium]|nr:peptide deformylase [Bryobacterales bacterium]